LFPFNIFRKQDILSLSRNPQQQKVIKFWFS